MGQQRVLLGTGAVMVGVGAALVVGSATASADAGADSSTGQQAKAAAGKPKATGHTARARQDRSVKSVKSPDAEVISAAAAASTVEVSRPAAASASSAAAVALAPTAQPAQVPLATGVDVGHSTLEIPCGPDGYTAPADWYFPTKVDGTVAAQGVIWLQHGFGATNTFYSALATNLAQTTNSIVVAPSLPWLPLGCADCWINGDSMQAAAADLFLGDRTALNASAVAAGLIGTLPEKYILAGHSAGGGFAVAVAADTVENGAAANGLLGVVMFDGVSSGGLTSELAVLEDIPVYQIAAPAQMWNAFGVTTNELVAARQGQFVGAVVVGGSHVDSMMGSNIIIDGVAQLVTRSVPAGNTQATYTLSSGWINDMYAGGTPDAPLYGIYAAPNQQVIMGNTASVGLPTPFANQLSPIDAALKSIIDFFGGLFGHPALIPTYPVSALNPAVTPPLTNGVTGVKTNHATLDIPCGPNGYATQADWYFPTQADGSVDAQGVIWLQHGFLNDKSWYSALAEQLALQTNSIVVAPNIFWFDTPFCPGCYLGGEQMREAAASMFLGNRAALNISANAAGFMGTLPEQFILTGHSAGGNFATQVAALTVENGAADGNLLGVVMFDGVAMSGGFTDAIATLDEAGIPTYQLAAPPQAWNAWGGTTELMSRLHPDQFTGIQIDNGSHADALIGGNWIADLGTQIVTKLSPAGASDAVHTFTTGWINDFYSGHGPTDPLYGIYGNPNDGAYAANESIVMGLATAATLPSPPPVDVADYLGIWYEVGSVKLPFEWGLVNTTAQYSLNQDGSIHVNNSGNLFSPNGPRLGIDGSAVPVNVNNTRLSVSFWFPPSDDEPGNYWILDYAPDYSWSIVSDSSGFSGYILSRTPTMSDAQYQALVDRARTLGVWGPITRTVQQY